MKKVTQKEAKVLIRHILTNHEDFKKAYFFSSSGNASSRRSYEKKNSYEYVFTFTKKGVKHTLELSSTVSCSCKNVYYKGFFKVDGKVVNITGVKKINLLLGGIN